MDKESEKCRCGWAEGEINITYHDTQWGRPVYDDDTLFEMLILEGMQAGLSWVTILKKREAMRVAFDNFDIDTIIGYDQEKIEKLMLNDGIIRNRNKLNSLVLNAKAFKCIQEKHESFSKFIWLYVDGQSIINSWNDISEVPSSTPLSEKISKDLKSLGFKFVGPTIIYAYLQSIGVVHDHTTNCFLHQSNL